MVREFITFGLHVQHMHMHSARALRMCVVSRVSSRSSTFLKRREKELGKKKKGLPEKNGKFSYGDRCLRILVRTKGTTTGVANTRRDCSGGETRYLRWGML